MLDTLIGSIQNFDQFCFEYCIQTILIKLLPTSSWLSSLPKTLFSPNRAIAPLHLTKNIFYNKNIILTLRCHINLSLRLRKVFQQRTREVSGCIYFSIYQFKIWLIISCGSLLLYLFLNYYHYCNNTFLNFATAYGTGISDLSQACFVWQL